MEIALWIVAGLLAAINLISGVLKIVAIERYRTQAHWAESAPNVFVRIVGVLEILGAIGLILPQLTGIATVLTPLAAFALAVLQAVALVLHIVRHEPQSLPINIVLILMALFVGWGWLLWA
jgi:uncharacterized membrane protein